MSARLLLAGYLGCGNLGDDAILLGFTEGVKDLDYAVRALAGFPGEMMNRYGISGVARKDMRAVSEAIQQCDALVFVGGSIFQDVTSGRSVAYYANLVRLAKKEKKKVVMLSQGVGPLNGFFARKAASSAFNAADAIAVRDAESARTLHAIGVKRAVVQSADLAFLLPEPEKREGAGDFGVGDMKSVGLAPRPWGRKNKDVIDLFSGLCQLCARNNIIPVLVEMDREHDGPVIQAIAAKQGGKVPDIRNLDSPRSLQARFGRMEAVLAMRLHAGILAATVGVPPYMLSYDPKVDALSNQLGLPAPPRVESATPERVFESFQSFLGDRDSIARSLQNRRAQLRSEAEKNIDVLQGALGS